MSTNPAPPLAEPPARRVDGSMSLLVDMMANTLDEAYAERAARKAGTPPPSGPVDRTPSRRGLVSAAVVVALGVMTGTAVSQVRDRQEADTGLRGRLAGEVRERTDESAALASRAEDLRQELDGLREAALGTDAAGRAARSRLRELALAGATLPVRGPGVVVTLDDAPAGDDTTPEQLEDGRVRDTDVQNVVNALWAAGAEAVSINGQRLTALTAKRAAGAAVLVDLLPLKPPYVVRAIGQPSALELGLLDGPAGRQLFDLSNDYGLRFDLTRADEQTLPGAADPELRYATPVERSGS